MLSNGKSFLSIFLKFIYVLTFLFISLFSYSYESARFTNITVDDGLASNYVTSIAQDSNGFMWFGTQSGLSRYDGYQFTNYQHILGVPSSLSDDNISTVVTDSKSNVWIGTLSGGLNRLNTITGKITRFTSQKNNPNSIRSNLIRYLYLEDDNTLWISTDKGLDILNIRTGQIDHINLTKGIASSLFVNNILKVNNSLWFATTTGLIIYNIGSHNITKITSNYRNKNILNNNEIYDLFQDNNNKI